MTHQATTIQYWHEKFEEIARKLTSDQRGPSVVFPPRLDTRAKDRARQTSIHLTHLNGLSESFFVCQNSAGQAEMTLALSWESPDKKEYRSYRLTSEWQSHADLVRWLRQQKEITQFGDHFKMAADARPGLTNTSRKPPTKTEQRILKIISKLREQGEEHIHPPMIVRSSNPTLSLNGVYVLLNRLEKKGWVQKKQGTCQVLDVSTPRVFIELCP